ncbi:MAG: DUF3108 domain-containing protein [Bdellovibrionales bacterium]|nr:DUF3108 domain-containing protein [Bdellovibrionales bacterium]
MALPACSTLGPDPITPSSELPDELPPELVQKFEIQDKKGERRPIPSPPPLAQEKPKDETKPPEGLNPTVAKVAPSIPTPTIPERRGSDRAEEDEEEDEDDKEDREEEAKAALAGKAKAATPVASPKGVGPFKYRKVARDRDPIWVGERQVYEITYFGMVAGELAVQAMPHKFINDRKVFYLRGHVKSSKVFSLFYRINDTVESFIDHEGLFSHRFHMILDETKQSRDSLELFDAERQQTYIWNRTNHRDKGYRETKKFKPMKEPFSQDSLSALYYLRFLPLKIGEKYRVPVVSEGKNWEAEVHVIRREILETAVGKVPTLMLKPLTRFRGVARQKGDSFLWVTDDDRRIVVRMHAKVRVGGVSAEIVEWSPGEAPAKGAAPGAR